MEMSDQDNLALENSNRGKKLSRLTLGIVGAAALVAPLAPNSSAVADTQPLEATIIGPYCDDGKNNFGYTVNNNQTSINEEVDVKLNGLNVDTFLVNPASSYIGHLATNLTFEQPYRLEIVSEDAVVGQPSEGLALNCEIKKVTPSAPGFNDKSGSKEDSVTIPSSIGAKYSLNGDLKDAGDYSVSGSILVEASAKEGFVFDQGVAQEWQYTFSDEITDMSTIPPFVPPIAPYNPAKNKKISKKYKKQCKKVTKIRDLSITNPYSPKLRRITKKENNYLKKKCKIKKPKIAGSTPNTKIFQKKPYNWGEKPFTYMIKGKPTLQIDEIDEIVYKDGQLKYINEQGLDYFDEYPDTYLDKMVTQESPTKNKPGQAVDKIFTLTIANRDSSFRKTGENLVVTAGLRKIGKNPYTIAEETVAVEDGNDEIFVIKDSNDTPASNTELEYDRGSLVMDAKNTILPKDGHRADKIKKAIFYFATRNEGGELYQYYQRAVLIGLPKKQFKKAGDQNVSPKYSPQINFKKSN